METPAEPVSDPPTATPQSFCQPILESFLKMAAAGELQSILIAYVRVDGGAAVQSTPMNAVTVNHLCRLIDRRVNQQYDRVTAPAGSNRSPTAGVPVNSPRAKERAEVAARLPRKVRRQLAVTERKAAAKKRPGLRPIDPPK